MYAIIATGGKQYKVAEGDVIRVEKLGVEAGETVTFDNVIAVSNDGLKAGEDVKDASVTATVVENGKAKKVIAFLCFLLCIILTYVSQRCGKPVKDSIQPQQ